jgi:hypothetical protein
MKKIIITLSAFLFGSCGILSDNSPEKLYKEFMNMEVPSSLKNFQGEGSITFPVFMSRGYFVYEADQKYFNYLLQNGKFIEESRYNIKISESHFSDHEIDVLLLAFKGDIKLEKPDNLKNKKVYAGTYFPYIHYLFRDTISNKTYHFVSGMRE